MCDKCKVRARRAKFEELESKARGVYNATNKEDMKDPFILSTVQNTYKYLEMMLDIAKGN